MKKLFTIILFFVSVSLFGQKTGLQEIEQKLAKSKEDTAKVDLLNLYVFELLEQDIDKAEKILIQSYDLIQKLNYKRGEAYQLLNLARIQKHYLSDESLGSAGKAIEIFDKIGDKIGLMDTYMVFASIYNDKGNYPSSLDFNYKALLLAETEELAQYKPILNLQISYIFSRLGNFDKSTTYLQNYFLIEKNSTQTKNNGLEQSLIGEIYTSNKKYTEAVKFYQSAQKLSKDAGLDVRYYTDELNIANAVCFIGDYNKAENLAVDALNHLVLKEQNIEIIWAYIVLSRIYLSKNQLDKALYYAKLGLANSEVLDLKELIRDSYEILYKIYENNGNKNKYKIYKDKYAAINDSLSGQFTRQLVEANQINFELENQKNQIVLLRKEGEINQSNLRFQRILLFSGIALVALFMGFIFVLYRNNKNHKRYNAELNTQKQEIELQKDQLESTLSKLKATQAQLIQSEKLASLGELTAGIAHEIQNPLNFVNNFSELSVELIEEAPKPPEGADENWIPQEIPYGGWGAFLGDLTQNLQKINHHGKRASSIVKGMLEHSRTSTGIKELTDINALADEYLRLAYHGLRAKDNTFNADFKTDFDENLPRINVVSQDIGRVLLNLINNAFQSQAPSAPKGGTFGIETKIQHKVVVNTQYMPAKDSPSGGWGAISITDNGSGIPDDIKAKIFQPFFTTKPTGQGTGLGLSLAYDIVTKGHGGTLECESVENVGTTFVIKLPIA